MGHEDAAFVEESAERPSALRQQNSQLRGRFCRADFLSVCLVTVEKSCTCVGASRLRMVHSWFWETLPMGELWARASLRRVHKWFRETFPSDEFWACASFISCHPEK